MDSNRIPDYSVHGEGDTTIFLLHGAYGSKEYWRYTIERLTGVGYRVVAWDAPGYGVSPLPKNVTITSMAHALARLVDHTGTKRNGLLGHSMGGFVAQKFCDLYPDRLKALVLSSTAHTFNHSGPEWQAEFMKTRVGPLTQGRKISEYAPDLLKTMMGPDTGGPVVDHVLYNIKLMSAEGFQAAIKATSEYLEDDVITRIAIPTLCIAGELDETCPSRVLKVMSGLVKQGEFYELKNTGHFGFAERPEEYHRVVLDFFKRKLA
jgi:pimeloyl-ACP methyl ester carboxylesterase